MNVKELKARQGSVDILLTIIEKGDKRSFSKFGKTGNVCNAEAKDDAGDKIKLTLWNEQIDQINAGDKIHLTEGWVGEWNSELQLSTGRNGKIEVVAKAEIQEKKEAPKEEPSNNVDEDFVE